MTPTELKEIVLGSNLTEKHKKVFLAVVETATTAGASELPPKPVSGTYTLKSVAGLLTWVADV